MPCPFLSRLPGTFIKNYATPLLKMYADQCPVVSRAVSVNNGPHYRQELASAFKHIGGTSDPSVEANSTSKVADDAINCPFLKEIGQDGKKKLVKASLKHEIFEERTKGNEKKLSQCILIFNFGKLIVVDTKLLLTDNFHLNRLILRL